MLVLRRAARDRVVVFGRGAILRRHSGVETVPFGRLCESSSAPHCERGRTTHNTAWSDVWFGGARWVVVHVVRRWGFFLFLVLWLRVVGRGGLEDRRALGLGLLLSAAANSSVQAALEGFLGGLDGAGRAGDGLVADDLAQDVLDLAEGLVDGEADDGDGGGEAPGDDEEEPEAEVGL